MFRSYWERAAKVTGERIADLSARPIGNSAEATGPDRPTAAVDQGDEGPATEPLSHLSGLISGVLESADHLAAVTRRTRRGAKATAESGIGDNTSG